MSKAREISDRLAYHAEAVCRTFLPNGRKVGHYWQVGNIHGDKGRSLCVRLCSSRGARRGRWMDYATGEHGDLLDIVAAGSGSSDLRSAMMAALRFLGQTDLDASLVPKPVKSLGQGGLRNTTFLGVRLFAMAKPIDGTLAEAYLRNRQIDRFGTALKFHPKAFVRDSCDKALSLPALLAAITDIDGSITGCARIFLNPQTAAIASLTQPKRMLGSLHGKAVRFPEVLPSCDQIVGEGLESMLSVGTALPGADIAACLTATNLSLYQPPARVTRLWVAQDNDKAGEQALSILKARADSSHFRVFHLPPLRNDHNDDLKAVGKAIMGSRLKQIIRSQVADAFLSFG